MQVSVSFRHMDSSEPLQEYATKKLENVVHKYVNGEDISSQVTFSTERFWHIANFTINVNGLTVKSTERSENMYSSVDLALDKIERQMRRYKTKIRSHKPSGKERPFTMGVLAPAEPPEPELDDAAFDDEVIAEPPVVVVKHETYTAAWMTPEEAVMQLNLREAQFYVFTNSENERINIVHRREDGSYGLIDAEPPSS